jgi:hypothetical protein
MKHPHSVHTATLLTDGRVLVAGGSNSADYLASSEIFHVGTEAWSAAGNLITGRPGHTATLLPDGRLLIAGGDGAGALILSSCEIYDRRLDFAEAWRPFVSQVPAQIIPYQELTFTGTGFRGLSEGSTGSTNQSATNYPLVQLRRVDNEQILWLSPGKPWSNSSFTSAPVGGLGYGHTLLTVFVNGLPSLSKLIPVWNSQAMPLPESQSIFAPAPSSIPVLNVDPALANPMGIGAVAEGGDLLEIRIGTIGFSGPADVYFAIFAPQVLGSDILLYTGTAFVALSKAGLVPWIVGTAGPLDQGLFGTILISFLPSGAYTLFFAVAPAGSPLSTFYLWSTTFTVP